MDCSTKHGNYCANVFLCRVAASSRLERRATCHTPASIARQKMLRLAFMYKRLIRDEDFWLCSSFFLIMQWRILSPNRAVWINFSFLNSIWKLFQFHPPKNFFHDTEIVFLCALISFFLTMICDARLPHNSTREILFEQSVLWKKIACEHWALLCLPTIFELVSKRTSKEIFFFHASRVPWW